MVHKIGAWTRQTSEDYLKAQLAKKSAEELVKVLETRHFTTKRTKELKEEIANKKLTGWAE